MGRAGVQVPGLRAKLGRKEPELSGRGLGGGSVINSETTPAGQRNQRVSWRSWAEGKVVPPEGQRGLWSWRGAWSPGWGGDLLLHISGPLWPAVPPAALSTACGGALWSTSLSSRTGLCLSHLGVPSWHAGWGRGVFHSPSELPSGSPENQAALRPATPTLPLVTPAKEGPGRRVEAPPLVPSSPSRPVMLEEADVSITLHIPAATSILPDSSHPLCRLILPPGSCQDGGDNTH